MKNNVKSIRIAKELTQSQLAAKMGVQAQTISNIERAKHKPSPITLQKLSRVLGVSINELFSDDDEQELAKVS